MDLGPVWIIQDDLKILITSQRPPSFPHKVKSTSFQTWWAYLLGWPSLKPLYTSVGLRGYSEELRLMICFCQCTCTSLSCRARRDVWTLEMVYSEPLHIRHDDQHFPRQKAKSISDNDVVSLWIVNSTQGGMFWGTKCWKFQFVVGMDNST